MEKPLARPDGTRLQRGDILVARVQYAGCSYHHRFVKVLYFTAKGMIRVETMGCKEQGRKEVGQWGSVTGVVPCVRAQEYPVIKPLLIHPDGHRKEDSTHLYFEFYSQGLNDLAPVKIVENNFDNGD